MATRPFSRSWTVRIIAWTSKGGSTQTIGLITPVKGDAVPCVGDLTVRIICVAPGPPTIAPCVTASFMVPIANVIVWSLSNVNLSKPASSAKPSTPLFPTEVTSVGTPNVPCLRSWCLSRTTSVTFNPWWRKRGMKRPRRGEVAWWRHPLPLFVYVDFEAMQNADGVFVANLLLFVDGGRDDPSVGWGGLCPIISSWFGWPGRCARQWWRAWDPRGVSQFERLRWYVYFALYVYFSTVPATARGGGPTDGGGQSLVFQERTAQIHWLAVFVAHATRLFSKHFQFDGIKEGVA